MIPLLTAQAVEKKCNFEHVILLGNYELAYGLGILAKASSIAKEESFTSVGELKEKVMEVAKSYKPDNVKMERLVRIVSEMESFTEDYDDQMYELYSMGYAKGILN